MESSRLREPGWRRTLVVNEEGGLALMITFDEESRLVLTSEELHLGPSRRK